MSKTLLIANRGEIALRINRTAKRLGYKTVAIFSDVDRGMPFVRAADAAFALGGNSASDTYLDVDKVLSIAGRAGADLIHPGYGFLSENASFAERCKDVGVTFVGPSASAITQMGDKAQAKLIARGAGVPCLDGFEGEAQGAVLPDSELLKEAIRMGFPLMIKAVAGGGGRGMRLVQSETDFRPLLHSARREAKSAFADERVILESYAPSGFHIEVQVVADSHGNIIHLGERECSVQRRHQKVIEEAPSPNVTPEVREQLGGYAIAVAKAANYLGVGTVEFIVTKDARVFFLEMNTRIQVEHPVTEMVTGLDLVELQLRIAEGEALPVMQNQVTIKGHAIEARVYAEDPLEGFAPQTGMVWRFEPARPSKVVPIRWDLGVAEGQQISGHYDAMIAKAIAYGVDREQARLELIAALHHTVLLGVTTNREWLSTLLNDPEFSAGQFTTERLDQKEVSDSLAQRVQNQITEARRSLHCVIGCALWLEGRHHLPATAFSNSLRHQSIVHLKINQSPHRFDVLEGNSHRVRLKHQGVEHVLTWEKRGDRTRLEVGGEQLVLNNVWTGETSPSLLFFTDGVNYKVAQDRYEPKDQLSGNHVVIPISGKVIKVSAALGQVVNAGDVAAVIESMKMEIAVKYPRSGKVARVAMSVGDQVTQGTVLAELSAD